MLLPSSNLLCSLHEISSYFYCYSIGSFKKYLPNILTKSQCIGYIWQKARVPGKNFTMSCILSLHGDGVSGLATDMGI
jgi:hypothetical protein